MANHFPPGFRFHPTDEELVAYYLRRKVNGRPSEFNIISDVDLYKQEPWDLPEKSHFVSNDSEWYFFSPRDKKYPNGHRTNRATVAGYWKATGKDRPVKKLGKVVGMKKTLVFYQGRAPHGTRTDWVMHEYRLEDEEKIQQDLYVLCRVFKKSGVGPRNAEDRAPTYEDEDDITEPAAPSTRGLSEPDTTEKKTATTPSGSTARAEVPPSGGVASGEAQAEELSVIVYTQDQFSSFNGSTPLEILDSEDFGTKFWDALGPAMTDDLLMWNPELGGSLDGFAIQPDDMLPPLVEERETDFTMPASTWNSSVDESGVPVETWGAPLDLQDRSGVSTDGLSGGSLLSASALNTAAIASGADLYTFHDSLFDFAGDEFPEDEESYLPALEEEDEYLPTIDFESSNFDYNDGLQDSNRFDIYASGDGDDSKVSQNCGKLPTTSPSSPGTSAPTKPLVAGLLKVLGSFPVLPASAAAFTEFPSDATQLQLGATRPSYGSIQVSAVTVTCTYPADDSQQVRRADGYEQVVGGAKVSGGKQKFVNCDTTVVGATVQKRVVHGSNMGFLFVFGLGAFSALGWYWALRLMWRVASKAISSVF